MARFTRLLRKDLENTSWSWGVLTGLTFVLILLARFWGLPRQWSVETVRRLLVLPLLMLPFWLIWQSFQTLRVEWRGHTVYTMLSLPVSGHLTLFSKLAAILVQFSAFFLIYLGSLLLFFKDVLPPVPISGVLIGNLLLFFFLSLTYCSALIALLQLAFVISKIVGQAEGFIVLWAVAIGAWVAGRASFLLMPLFRWLPPFASLHLFDLDTRGMAVVVEWQGLHWIGGFLVVLGFFWLAGYLLENHVEIS